MLYTLLSEHLNSLNNNNNNNAGLPGPGSGDHIHACTRPAYLCTCAACSVIDRLVCVCVCVFAGCVFMWLFVLPSLPPSLPPSPVVVAPGTTAWCMQSSV
jgi:hypothetical protein